MIPEEGQRSVFRDFVLTMPMEGLVYFIEGKRISAWWRVSRVTATECVLMRVNANGYKLMPLARWTRLMRIGAVQQVCSQTELFNRIGNGVAKLKKDDTGIWRTISVQRLCAKHANGR